MLHSKQVVTSSPFGSILVREIKHVALPDSEGAEGVFTVSVRNLEQMLDNAQTEFPFEFPSG